MEYSKNYLKNVIARVDFMIPVTAISTDLHKDIIDKISEIYPIFEHKDIIEQEFVITNDNGDNEVKAQTQIKKSKEWNFYSQEDRNRVCIYEKCFFIQYNKYSTFEPLNKYFIDFLEDLLNHYDQILIKRLGLRYVNIFDDIEGDVFEWTNYIKDSLLSNFTFSDIAPICRSMNEIEYKFEEYNIRFKFGMNNPDYPNIIKQKHFILDYDGYSVGNLDINDIKTLLPQMNNSIYNLFESSIGESLRSVMK